MFRISMTWARVLHGWTAMGRAAGLRCRSRSAGARCLMQGDPRAQWAKSGGNRSRGARLRALRLLPPVGEWNKDVGGGHADGPARGRAHPRLQPQRPAFDITRQHRRRRGRASCSTRSGRGFDRRRVLRDREVANKIAFEESSLASDTTLSTTMSQRNVLANLVKSAIPWKDSLIISYLHR